MNELLEKFKNPIYAAIGGGVIGLLVGWIFLGWLVFPVKWQDAGPEQLSAEWQEEYLQLVANNYNFTGDKVAAKGLYDSLGPAGEDTLKRLETGNDMRSPMNLEGFKSAIGSEVSSEAEAPATADGEAAEPEKKGLSPLIWGACLVTLILGAAVLGLYVLRSRNKGFSGQTDEDYLDNMGFAGEDNYEVGPGYEDEGAPALGRFMTTFNLGEDLFDDSFSIDSPAGEFLGECGIGIADTIGVGDPKKVSAFEVWLFDKNDIQTVTKVLLSNHAYNDLGTRDRLSAKGEPIIAEPGQEFVLETATLQLAARVVDLDYGTGALPDESYFGKLSLEMVVWHK